MDDKYKYSYVNDGSYCYLNTNILINKLNIKDDEELHKQERKLVSLRVSELFDNPIKGNFDFIHLKEIHKFLFQDIYSWAGEIRTCAIAKKDLFCLPQFIENYATEVFGNIEKDDYYIKYDYEVTIMKLVDLFSDINALHPFREGNGRTQREFIECLAKVCGIDLDLTSVPKIDMVIASYEGVNGHNEELYKMFKEHSKKLSKEKQLEYIETYCNNKLADKLKIDL